MNGLVWLCKIDDGIVFIYSIVYGVVGYSVG